MSYRDSMTMIEGPNDYSIGLINDTWYNPDSADNVVSYSKYYIEKSDQRSANLTRHGIFFIRDGEIEKTVCVSSSGGHTGIHSASWVLDEDRFLICCANSIFSLTLPSLDLNWITKADHATCFGIYTYENSYVIHGELEITRLDKDGRIIWQFPGSDIFTTLAGRDDFKLIGDVIETVNWDGVRFRIDAKTGQPVYS
jgi:hypothetical protein